jgi:N-methylhydantoinase A/oxoprolinase/acetone carboxylase beta subunit
MSSVDLAVDVGGTFTDLVAVDQNTGRLAIGKLLTTPEDPGDAILYGIETLLAENGWDWADLAGVVHATTLVSNALIERKGAPTALLTTRGFRDTLEIGHEFRYHLHDLAMRRPAPLVPREWRFEVDERVGPAGEVLQPLDEDGLRRIAARLRADGVASVAICFLHAYANPAHEEAAERILAEALPGVPVSLSHRICPERGEYARTSTVVASAYVRPLIAGYLETLEARLRARGLAGPFRLMVSDGGSVPAAEAAAAPVRLLESGPAAGVLAARHQGGQLGLADLVSFEMGGTTAKVCLIEGGAPALTTEGEAARLSRFRKGSGLAIHTPLVDLLEVGAGGGSIARVDAMGLLKVGPESAGADPGPACYGRGGAEATVTDANLVLGYLDPAYFLGGAMPLDPEAARRALATRLAGPLGLTVEEAAAGVHRVVTEAMASALRVHLAERGRDPRRYALFAAGGAGPAHAVALARLLGMPRVVCPPGAGAAAAFGCLATPPLAAAARTLPGRLDDLAWPEVNTLLEALEAEARARLAAAGATANIAVGRLVEMRYAGQGNEVPVPLPTGPLGPPHRDAIAQSFAAVYHDRFGHTLPDAPLEAVTWRVRATGPAPVRGTDLTPGPFPPREGVPPSGSSSSPGAPGTPPDPKGVPPSRVGKGDWGLGPTPQPRSRPVYFPEPAAFVPTAVYDRYSLPSGATLAGPAIVEERESTLILPPDSRAMVDAYGNVVIEPEPGKR